MYGNYMCGDVMAIGLYIRPIGGCNGNCFVQQAYGSDGVIALLCIAGLWE